MKNLAFLSSDYREGETVVPQWNISEYSSRDMMNTVITSYVLAKIIREACKRSIIDIDYRTDYQEPALEGYTELYNIVNKALDEKKSFEISYRLHGFVLNCLELAMKEEGNLYTSHSPVRRYAVDKLVVDSFIKMSKCNPMYDYMKYMEEVED